MRARTDFCGGRASGFSLVEMLVVVAILAGIVVGIYGLLDSSSRIAKQETLVADAQQSVRAGIQELVRIVRQARAGQLYYGSAILPVANNVAGGQSVRDISDTDHFIRRGTDVLRVRGVLFGDEYALTSGDVTCSGSCDGTSVMTITIRATANSGVVNYPAGSTPSLASKTRPFYFVVVDSSNQTVTVGSTIYLVPLYYVGRVEVAGPWYTQTPTTFTFSMNPQDAGARQLNATVGGSPALQKPFLSGAVDDALLFVDEGPQDRTGSTADAHPVLSIGLQDPATGRFAVTPLVGEVEDFQVAYGIDGIDGSTPDRGISPAAVNAGGVNQDEWVGNVATEIETSLTLSTSGNVHVDGFIDGSVASGPPNPSLATPALRSIWFSLVVKSADPDGQYGGPGATGIRMLDSAALSFSDPSSTGGPYRRRVQSFAVALRNYQ
ncbi:MAG TPA: prepilin-type N-terminal cleavage/methylation domain-containing protein [Thermoanaerobaculia bacterium]|nr:prepilin-type N-terminal cleavage/methylation domain-containing protein [Thermoanaerobaculia bacterium]